MIQSVGEWVLYTACRQQRIWYDEYKQDQHMAVNISPKQLTNGHFFTQVREILNDTGLSPDQLCLEITENALLAEDCSIAEALSDLKALGIRIALDDFGTGYSSLSHLRHFPISCLKIDQSFINLLPNSLDDSELTKAIISLGKNLHLNIIAEGVETKEQLMALQVMGCRNVQGYYFSRPTEAEQLSRDFH